MTVSAIVLAAGMSKRMGPTNKLLVDLGGETMVRRVVKSVLASKVELVVVVTGYQTEQVETQLKDLNCRLAFNPAYEDGLASTLGVGLAVLPQTVDAALIVLGDMPKVSSQHINRLLKAYASAQTKDIAVPIHKTQRGNPVLFARRYFRELEKLTGDIGGRSLLQQYRESVCEVPMPDEAVLLDVDQPSELACLQS